MTTDEMIVSIFIMNVTWIGVLMGLFVGWLVQK